MTAPVMSRMRFVRTAIADRNTQGFGELGDAHALFVVIRCGAVFGAEGREEVDSELHGPRLLVSHLRRRNGGRDEELFRLQQTAGETLLESIPAQCIEGGAVLLDAVLEGIPEQRRLPLRVSRLRSEE